LELVFNLSLELAIDRIDGQGTGTITVLSSESDISVDVGHALGIAWRPHSSGNIDVILLGVGSVERTLDLVAGGCLEI